MVTTSVAASSVLIESHLVGTWKIMDLDSAGYSGEEAKSLDMVCLKFGDDNSYLRFTQYKDGSFDPKLGKFAISGDSIKVHWLNPSLGEDYVCTAALLGDTLTLKRIDQRWPSVRLERIADSLILSAEELFPVTTVPTILIEQFKEFPFGEESIDLVNMFYRLVLNDSAAREEDEGFVKTIVDDLDGDSTEEVVILVGWNFQDTRLAVFKLSNLEWKLMSLVAVNSHYHDPDFGICGKAGKSKVFFTNQLVDRGSGILRELIQFYTLINGEVLNCLNIVKEAHIYGWGLYLNQEVTSHFGLSSDDSSSINVTYTYNFFPGSVMESDRIFNAHEDIPFVKGEEAITYEWNAALRTFKPLFSGDVSKLNDPKLFCFGSFGEDSLFLDAYRNEVQEQLDHGNDTAKTLLREFIERVHKYGTAPDQSGPVEKTNTVGGTDFYAPKKK